MAAADWVARSLAGLTPVAAGRFIVHGAHDRAGVGANRIGIEIEAALAFGTGHHGTTRGCLLALDELASGAAAAQRARRRHRLRRAGDRRGASLRCPVIAVDIDALAVAVARANARLNGAGALVSFARANGPAHSRSCAGMRLTI